MKNKKMSELAVGNHAIILEINCDEKLRRRLFDMGLTPGTRTECVLISHSGSPMAFYVRGAVIALRRADCDNILINHCTSNTIT